MKPDPNRRLFIGIAASSVALAGAGCSKSNVPEAVAEAVDNKLQEASTEQLRQAKVVLHGYAIVSMVIGKRLVFLPKPGMRILAVLIIATSVAASLSIEYIDDELIRRKFDENLTPEERSQIESSGSVTFQTESGATEDVRISPTVYS